jgi:hypothetical protein
MRFPSIKTIARELRNINANVEGDCDVRLQVYNNGEWAIRFGLSDYDTDHRGYWGCGLIPGVVDGKVTRFNAYGLARELLDQAKESAAY